jgi:hypothetical protein
MGQVRKDKEQLLAEEEVVAALTKWHKLKTLKSRLPKTRTLFTESDVVEDLAAAVKETATVRINGKDKGEGSASK